MSNSLRTKLITKNSKLWSILLSFLALTLTFAAGSFYSNTKFEKIADYASTVVKNNTEKKKYCCVNVGPGEGSDSIADSTSEFHNLYGAFRQEKVTFASTINSEREHEIYLPFGISDNLALFYSGATGTVEYHDCYRHTTYPIQTMFPDGNYYDISDYAAYISQTHADKLLEHNNIKSVDGKYSLDDYEKLLGSILTISIDGKPSDFVIQNIYYEIDYYYEGISDVVGDFIMVSYYLPFELRKEQKNMYFMSEYSYQNKYFMSYINKLYSSKNYTVELGHFNIIGQVNDDYLLSFYYSDILTSNDWISVFLLVLSCALLLISIVLFYRSCNNVRRKTDVLISIISAVVLFIPFSIFWLIYKITSNPSFLSEFSSKSNTIMILVYLIAMIVSLIKNRRNLLIEKHQLQNGEFYEINI